MFSGAAEYQTVTLTPSNWAFLAKEKAASTTPQAVTVDSLSLEITNYQVQLAHLYSSQAYMVDSFNQFHSLCSLKSDNN